MSEATLDQVLSQRHEVNKDIVNVDEPAVKLVIFALGDDWFAFHSERIREILAQADIFFVPGCPPSLEGVINVRGDIESVIRPHEMLHLPDNSEGGRASAILLGRGGGMSSGIRVDRVVDVVDVPQSSIRPPPSTLPEHMRVLVLGVLRFQEQPVAVLDLDKMFVDYARGLG
ncbi:MAG: chemotaxis protein CheW [Rhodoferax sp.]|jgi:purine-binding chemotaxis protein CheW|nr:chemotaxis protein CheW [Rhodoferax sp.]